MPWAGRIWYDRPVIAVQKQGLRQLDWTVIGSVLLICLGGVLAIKSAKHVDPHALDFVRKQAFGVVVGGAILLGLALSDYTMLIKRFAGRLYAINLIALLIVKKFGASSHGAARWISLGPVQVQPSEFAKFILICTLALFLVKHADTIRTWPTVLMSLVHIGVPTLLVASQPDLGTALVLMAIWFGMMTVGGAKASHLLLLLLAGVLLFTAVWHFNVVLKPYQKHRLEVFLDPNADPQDTGYHLHQSEIAIGSGQIGGEGYGRGTQSNGNFIPEQHTDFIFTIVGEEGGFVGCLVLLALYLLVLERGVAAMAECEDRLGRLLAGGVLSLLTFHVVVNAGMTMGIMPVVGVPLPFFSYGLSSLLVNMAAIGLLLSIAARKHRMMF
jgi:rod shape determining protein RodA